MDLFMIFIFCGFILSGIIIGIPFGILYDRRRFNRLIDIVSENTLNPDCRKCAERDANYWAEVID